MVTVPHASRPNDNNQGTRCERKQVAAGASLPRPWPPSPAHPCPRPGAPRRAATCPTRRAPRSPPSTPTGAPARKAPGSDNWPTTWASDGSVYAAWGDGGGFGNARVSLGFARLRATRRAPSTGPTSRARRPRGSPTACWRSAPRSTPGSAPARTRATTTRRASTRPPSAPTAWTAATWAFTKDDAAHLILPTFLQAGKDYAEVKDYVYVYAARYDPKIPGQLSIQGASGNGEIALLRAPKKSDLLAAGQLGVLRRPDGRLVEGRRRSRARDRGPERRRLDGERRLRSGT